MRRPILALTLLALSVPLPATADTSAPSICNIPEGERPELVEPVELCGTTTITGDGAGSIMVRLPEPVEMPVSLTKSSAVDIEGAGRFIGVVLADPAVANATQDVVFLAGRYQKCTIAGCSAPRPQDVTIPTDTGTATIPAGDFRLYFLADGAPASVTLRLEGLEGSLRLSPSTPTSSEIRSPDCRLETGPVVTSCAVRESVDAGGPSLVLPAVWANWGGGPGVTGSACVYRAAARPPTLPFWQFCLDEDSLRPQGGVHSLGNSGPTEKRATVWGVYGLPPGSWNVDQQIDVAGIDVEVGALLITLRY